MNEPCKTCRFYDRMNAEKGKCKVDAPKRNVAYAGEMNEVKIINGWPVVMGNENHCNKWKAVV